MPSLFGILPFSKHATRYTRVGIDDCEKPDSEDEISREASHAGKWWETSTLRAVACITLLAFAIASIGFLSVHGAYLHVTSLKQSSCQSPRVRREWRSLSTAEQWEYIRAAQCLQHVPSKLHPGMSLYDDFPFLHDVVGDYGTLTEPDCQDSLR
jgi:hypothetical protein